MIATLEKVIAFITLYIKKLFNLILVNTNSISVKYLMIDDKTEVLCVIHVYVIAQHYALGYFTSVQHNLRIFRTKVYSLLYEIR